MKLKFDILGNPAMFVTLLVIISITFGGLATAVIHYTSVLKASIDPASRIAPFVIYHLKSMTLPDGPLVFWADVSGIIFILLFVSAIIHDMHRISKVANMHNNIP